MVSQPEVDPDRPVRRRGLRRSVAVLLVLGVLFTFPWLLLRSHGVRAALLARVAAALEARLALVATARDFEFEVAAHRLVLYEVTLTRPGAEQPFLSVPRAVARFRWRDLLHAPRVIATLSLEDPVWDLDAPLAGAQEGAVDGGVEHGDACEEAPAVLEVDRLVVHRGTVRSERPPPGLERWIAALRWRALEAQGDYRHGFRLRFAPSPLELVGAPGQPSRELSLEGGLAIAPDGALSFDSMALEGPGIHLRAAGTGALGEDARFDLRFELDSQPGQLLSGLPQTSRLMATGDLELNHRTGSIHADAREIPAEFLQPWLGAAGRVLSLEGGMLELTTDVELGGSDPAATRGTGHLRWRQGDVVVLEADGTITEPAATAAAAAVRLRLEAQVLPARPGRRSLATTVEVPALDALDRLRFQDLRLVVDEPDLETLADALGHLTPMASDTLALAARRGGLNLAVHADGLARSPNLALEGTWQAASGARLAVFANGRLLQAAGALEIDAEGLALGVFDPSLAGTTIDRLALALHSDGRRLAIDRLTLAAGSRVLEARGQALLETTSRGRLADLRLRSADLAVDSQRLVAPGGGMLGLGRIAGQLRLEDGVLSARDTRVETPAGALRGELRLPLAALGPVLGAGAADAVARWVVAPARGALHVRAELPAFDSASGLAMLGQAPLPVRLVGDASMVFDWDLEQPAPSDASLVIEHAALRSKASELRAVGPLRLAFEQGRLTLAPLAWTSDELALRISARTTLDPGWRAGDRLLDALGTIEVSIATGAQRSEDPAGRWSYQAVAGLLGIDPAGVEARARGALELEVDPKHPSAARGTLTLREVEAMVAGVALEAPALRLRLDEHRLTLEETSVRGGLGGGLLRVHGTVSLAHEWGEDALIAEWIEHLDVAAEGDFDASVVNPYLAGVLGGSAARGPVAVTVAIRGVPGDLRGHASLSGPRAELILARPYFSRIDDLAIDLALEGSAVRFDNSHVRLNQGEVRLTGGRSAGGDVEIRAVFDNVHYRFDYGLTTSLAGDLRLIRPVRAAPPQIAGEVVLERGEIRRYLDPDRALLRKLFSAEAGAAARSSTLDNVLLDIDLRTQAGVRIQNNLADLRASWGTLAVRGTLAEPRVAGRIDTDPDGFVFAYGQTLRVDRATLELFGDPTLEPALDFVVTTAAEDPEVARQGAARFPAALRPEDATSGRPGSPALSAGIAGYYANRVASQLANALGPLELGVSSELLVFGETDPSTRLTIGRDVSSRVSIAASFDLKDSGDTTYVLDLHDFAPIDRLVAQVFTTDQEDQGLTVQQIVELGGPAGNTAQPRLRQLSIEAPKVVRKRRLRRAVGFEKGDRLPPGAEFDIEMDVAAYLARLGYPGAQVEATIRDLGKTSAALAVRVDPGPQVALVFEGDRPPKAARRAIATIYRPDLYEPATIEEMRQETVRALGVQGYRQPQVAVRVEVGDPADPEARRTVVIHADGGQREHLGPPRFEGLDPAGQAALEARFADPVSRLALAANDSAVHARLRAELAALGYPAAQIGPIVLEQGRTTIHLNAGVRQTLAAVRIEGIEPEVAAEMMTSVPLAVGDAARRDTLATAALRLERALRHRGRAAARVRGELLVSETDPLRADAVLRVRDARMYRLAEVRFEGRKHTRQRFAARVTGLESGAPLREDEIAEARRRLYQLGAWSAVVPRTELHDDGTGVVVFDLTERSRYRFAFGGRWASSEGVSTVVDVLDRNGFGRGVRLGVRGRVAQDDQSARFFGSLPNVFGTKASLDLFLEGREEQEGELRTSSVDATLQVSVPHGRRTVTRYYGKLTDQSTSDLLIIPIIGTIEIQERTKLPTIGFQWLRDSRDDRIDPQRGSLLSLDFSGTGSALSSDFSFLRLLVQGSVYRRLGSFRKRPMVWAQSLRVGLADTFDNAPVLRSQRFFAGGEYSVRGYDEDSLGPREDLGGGKTRASGGQGLLTLSSELRIPLRERLLWVVFLDAGNVYASIGDTSAPLFKSIGLGLRARTPLGLLRGDLAIPLDSRETDASLQLYLGFGHTF